MQTINLLQQQGQAFAAGFSSARPLSDSGLRTRKFSQAAEVIVQSDQIGRAICWPKACRRTSASPRADIVLEHLCVRRLFTDLLAMLERGEPLAPGMNVLPEPSREQHERAERAVSTVREANIPADENQPRGSIRTSRGGDRMRAGCAVRNGPSSTNR